MPPEPGGRTIDLKERRGGDRAPRPRSHVEAGRLHALAEGCLRQIDVPDGLADDGAEKNSAYRAKHGRLQQSWGIAPEPG